MEIFSRYTKVTEPDGSRMRVREALSVISKALDELLSEYEDDFDADTRWCIKWFEEQQWEAADFGEADKLANRYNTSVTGLIHTGTVKSAAGRAQLVKPADLPAGHASAPDKRLTVWEMAMRLSQLLEGKGPNSGIDTAGELLAQARTQAEIDEDAIKGLAYLLNNICEQKGWTESQRWFNNLVSSWPDLQTAARVVVKAGITTGDDKLF
jgi:putative DNA methylase